MDVFYMKKAITLAKLGEYTTSPNPNVGCIIVKNNIIVGEGWHKKTGEEHAETIALKKAGQRAKNATAYITLEPCSHFGHTPPCCVSLIESGVLRVVIATMDPNPKVSGNGIKWLEKKGILVTIGVMSEEAKDINQPFFKRMQTGLPWIQLKLGVSLDGRSALNNGMSKWITSIESRNDVQLFRRKSNAILSSSQTIITDNPLLNVRYIKKTNVIIDDYKKIEQPIRIIIDSKNRVTPYHKLINDHGEIWLIRLIKDKKKWPKNVKQIIISKYNNKINLLKLFYYLGKNEINLLWIEAGALLSGALIKMNIIDEIIIYMSPKILGNHGKPLFILENYSNFLQVPNFIFKKVINIGPDIRLTLVPKKYHLQLLKKN